MPTTFTNQPKTATGLTWDEATMSWDSQTGTWDYPISFAPQPRSSTTFTNQSRSSGTLFSETLMSTLESSTFDDDYIGTPIKDRTFNDLIYTQWANQTKS